jgi:AraC-like DNA-binding protein
MKQPDKNLNGSNPEPDVMTAKMVFLLKLKRCLDKHLDNVNVNASLLATEMEMSKSTLNRKLKSILNQSISDFVKQYRLQRSIEFLEVGYKVSEVAQRVGFNTPSYFAQCFKAYYQKTPSAFYNG